MSAIIGPANSQRAGWASVLGELVAAPQAAVVSALRMFVGEGSAEQVEAWDRSVEILQADGRKLISLDASTVGHGSILEYLLPREGGRRPDVILLQDAAVLVIEFKNTDRVHVGDIDQVAAYARDLHEYHSACRDLPVIPILLYLGKGPRLQTAGVTITTPEDFLALVSGLARKFSHRPPKVVLTAWLQGRYEPLPGIVDAARLLYKQLPLPFIRRARSMGIPDTVNYVLDVFDQARKDGRNHLVLLTGVPGAGKTLVGLQVVHNDRLPASLGPDQEHCNPAAFLSGNAPLVAVLQDALHSRAFVQDMHRFIREYAIQRLDVCPSERLLIFDEAQRAWTADKVEDFYRKRNLAVRHSEPEMLVSVADRIPSGCVILGLIGSGQEIHTGEECGIEGWLAAIDGSRRRENWTLHSPPGLIEPGPCEGVPRREEPRLSLDTTIRSHAAEDLHKWVNGLLDTPGQPEGVLASLGESLLEKAFPILLTRDLEWARGYARARFAGEPLRRFGLLASSKAKNLSAFGLDIRFDRFFPTAKWFNADPADPRSCCQLVKPAQEFHCQGLELDLPIVCWGDDFWWKESADSQEMGWRMRTPRPNRLVKDPYRFRKNTYRVLLTRGREGLVIFVPPGSAIMDATAARLERCGAQTVEIRSPIAWRVA
ncbi:MAG: DUF2075 domain-containing protein [Kiritimatiellae bacterium]|nr:DUF2075 domain-containing protein [Kiritimatiellia bacterium]